MIRVDSSNQTEIALGFDQPCLQLLVRRSRAHCISHRVMLSMLGTGQESGWYSSLWTANIWETPVSSNYQAGLPNHWTSFMRCQNPHKSDQTNINYDKSRSIWTSKEMYNMNMYEPRTWTTPQHKEVSYINEARCSRLSTVAAWGSGEFRWEAPRTPLKILSE